MVFSTIHKIFFVLALTLASLSPVAAAEFFLVDGVNPGQKGIVIRGEIKPGDDRKFFRLAERAERASVVLESPGGSVEAGLSIGAEIAIRGFTTLVLDGAGCHSICAVMWVAGERRYMSPNANISVHAAYQLVNNKDGSVSAPVSGSANAQIGAFLNEIGLNFRAIEYFTFANPSEQLLPITPEIAQMLSLDVFIQDQNSITSPADRPTPRRIARQVADLIGMSESCSVLFDVNGELWRAQAESILAQGHRTFGSEAFVQILGEHSSMAKSEFEGLGFVRWCLLTEANLRRDDLTTYLNGPSYNCRKAETRTEHAICSSVDLWALDRAMSNLYFYFRNNSTTTKSQGFLASQRNWLARRDECGSNVACLAERYRSRLFDFGV